ESEAALNEALRLARKARDEFGQAKVYAYLGRVARARAETDPNPAGQAARAFRTRAAEWMDLSIRQHRQAGRTGPEARERIERAHLALGAGELAEAEAQLQAAGGLLARLDSPWHTALYRWGLGRLHSAQGRPEEAEEALHQALAYFDQCGDLVRGADVQLD